MRCFALWVLLLCLCATEAAAQDTPCTARGLDAFASARRARRVVEDYNTLHHAIQRDLNALDAGQLAVGAPLPSIRAYGAPIVDLSLWPDNPTCLDGQRRDASLFSARFGGLAGGEVRDIGLRFELFWVTGGDSLTINIPDPPGTMRGEGEGDPNDVILGQSQVMFGARVQLTRWAEVTIGRVSDERSPDPLNPSQVNEEGPARVYLALGVPALNLRTDLILDQRDQSLQTLYLDMNRLSLLDSGFAVSARAGYLQDEDQVFTALGLVIPIIHDKRAQRFITEQPDAPPLSYNSREGTFTNLYPEVSVEWDSPRLRHARLRGEIQRTILADYEDSETISVMGAPYVDMGMFWEATTFNSRALEQRAGERWAWGWGGGAHLSVGLRAMSINLDTSFHNNRPETIAQLSELTGVGEWRMLMSWRVGW